MKLTMYRNDNPDGSGGGLDNGNDVGDLITGLDLGIKELSADELAAQAKTDADALTAKAAEDAKIAAGASTDAGADTKFEAVEIEGVKYKLNETGDAINAEGQVVKTKAEIDALVADQLANDTPLVSEVIQKAGYQLLDETGKPKQYEDSVEGIIEMTKDLAKTKVKEEQKKLHEAYPEIKNYTDFILRGGNPAEYHKKQADSWRNVKLDETNEGQLTTIVVAELMATGMDKIQAEVTAKAYKDTDKLKEFGKAAYKRLVTQETIADQNHKLKIEQDAIAEDEAIGKHWDSINSIVKKGTIHNIVIPEADRDGFFDYISTAKDDNGNSQVALDRSKMPIDQQLFIDFLIYKKFDFSKLITSAVTREKVLKLRERLNNAKEGAEGSRGINKDNYKKATLEDISLDTIM